MYYNAYTSRGVNFERSKGSIHQVISPFYDPTVTSEQFISAFLTHQALSITLMHGVCLSIHPRKKTKTRYKVVKTQTHYNATLDLVGH